MTMGGFPPQENIPLFVVGYTGWQNIVAIRTSPAIATARLLMWFSIVRSQS
jgi:hypothetical protein